MVACRKNKKKKVENLLNDVKIKKKKNLLKLIVN